MRLRIHHLLCVPLYQGHGYSEAFTFHMNHVVSQLRSDCSVDLVTEPDEICSACPNCSPDAGTCHLDDNHVETKDELLKELLFPEKGEAAFGRESVSSRRLWKYMQDHMTQEIFENSCSRCDWYQQGFCSWEKYKEGLKNLNNL